MESAYQHDDDAGGMFGRQEGGTSGSEEWDDESLANLVADKKVGDRDADAADRPTASSGEGSSSALADEDPMSDAHQMAMQRELHYRANKWTTLTTNPSKWIADRLEQSLAQLSLFARDHDMYRDQCELAGTFCQKMYSFLEYHIGGPEWGGHEFDVFQSKSLGGLSPLTRTAPNGMRESKGCYDCFGHVTEWVVWNLQQAFIDLNHAGWRVDDVDAQQKLTFEHLHETLLVYNKGERMPIEGFGNSTLVGSAKGARAARGMGVNRQMHNGAERTRKARVDEVTSDSKLLDDQMSVADFIFVYACGNRTRGYDTGIKRFEPPQITRFEDDWRARPAEGAAVSNLRKGMHEAMDSWGSSHRAENARKQQARDEEQAAKAEQKRKLEEERAPILAEARTRGFTWPNPELYPPNSASATKEWIAFTFWRKDNPSPEEIKRQRAEARAAKQAAKERAQRLAKQEAAELAARGPPPKWGWGTHEEQIEAYESHVFAEAAQIAMEERAARDLATRVAAAACWNGEQQDKLNEAREYNAAMRAEYATLAAEYEPKLLALKRSGRIYKEPYDELEVCMEYDEEKIGELDEADTYVASERWRLEIASGSAVHSVIRLRPQKLVEYPREEKVPKPRSAFDKPLYEEIEQKAEAARKSAPYGYVRKPPDRAHFALACGFESVEAAHAECERIMARQDRPNVNGVGIVRVPVFVSNGFTVEEVEHVRLFGYVRQIAHYRTWRTPEAEQRAHRDFLEHDRFFQVNPHHKCFRGNRGGKDAEVRAQQNLVLLKQETKRLDKKEAAGERKRTAAEEAKAAREWAAQEIKDEREAERARLQAEKDKQAEEVRKKKRIGEQFQANCKKQRLEYDAAERLKKAMDKFDEDCDKAEAKGRPCIVRHPADSSKDFHYKGISPYEVARRRAAAKLGRKRGRGM